MIYTGLTGKFLKYIKKENKVDISNFNVDSFVIPVNFGLVNSLIRKAFPSLFAIKIIGVQPMTEPIVIPFALKYIKEK